MAAYSQTHTLITLYSRGLQPYLHGSLTFNMVKIIAVECTSFYQTTVKLKEIGRHDDNFELHTTAKSATVKLRSSNAQLSNWQLFDRRECYGCLLVVRNPVTMCCLDNVTFEEKSRSGTEPRIPRQKTIFRASQLAARFPGLAVVVADVAVVAVADDDVAASQRKRCFATFWIDEIALELFRTLHFGAREINRSDNYSKCDICI